MDGIIVVIVARYMVISLNGFTCGPMKDYISGLFKHLYVQYCPIIYSNDNANPKFFYVEKSF